MLQTFNAGNKTIQHVVKKMGSIRIFPRFESLIDDIRRDLDPELHISKVFSSQYYNKTHFLLGTLILRGATVVTTNFDICIENALGNSKYNTCIFDGKDINSPDESSLVGLFKPHGSIGLDHRSLVISVEALAKTDRGFLNYPNWRTLLLKIFSKELVLVLGYSGSDDFDITPILRDAKPKQIVWLHYDKKLDIPQLMKKNEMRGLSIYEKLSGLPFNIYRGNLSSLTEQLLNSFSVKFNVPVSKHTSDVFNYYVKLKGDTKTRRQELINTLLWHYQVYDLVIEQTQIGVSPLLDFQLIKSLYSSGHYAQIIDIFNKTDFSEHPYEMMFSYYYSSCLCYTGRLLESIEVAEALLDRIQETIDIGFKINLHNHLAALYWSNNAIETAEKNYQMALSLNKNISIDGYATSQWGLGDISLTREKFPQALEYYNEARSTYEKLGSQRGLAFSNLNVAEIHIKMSQFEYARKHLKLAEDLFSSLNHVVGQIYVFNAFVKILYVCGQYNECKLFLKKVQTIVTGNPAAPPAIYTQMLRLMFYINSTPSSNELKEFIKSVRKEILIFEDGEEKEFLCKQLDSVEYEGRDPQEIKQTLENYLLPLP